MTTQEIREFLERQGRQAEIDKLAKRREMLRAAAIANDSHWVLRLRPLAGHGAPAICRMRRLLKAIKRSYGFSAEEHYQIAPDTGPTHEVV